MARVVMTPMSRPIKARSHMIKAMSQFFFDDLWRQWRKKTARNV
jgi:hypothetical protein